MPIQQKIVKSVAINSVKKLVKIANAGHIGAIDSLVDHHSKMSADGSTKLERRMKVRDSLIGERSRITTNMNISKSHLTEMVEPYNVAIDALFSFVIRTNTSFGQCFDTSYSVAYRIPQPIELLLGRTVRIPKMLPTNQSPLFVTGKYHEKQKSYNTYLTNIKKLEPKYKNIQQQIDSLTKQLENKNKEIDNFRY